MMGVYTFFFFVIVLSITNWNTEPVLKFLFKSVCQTVLCVYVSDVIVLCMWAYKTFFDMMILRLLHIPNRSNELVMIKVDRFSTWGYLKGIFVNLISYHSTPHQWSHNFRYTLLTAYRFSKLSINMYKHQSSYIHAVQWMMDMCVKFMDRKTRNDSECVSFSVTSIKYCYLKKQ